MDVSDQDRLLSRLHCESAREIAKQEDSRNTVSELLSQHRAQPDARSQKLDTIGMEISSQVAQGWELFHNRICETQQSSFCQIEELSLGLVKKQFDLTDRLQTLHNDQIDRFKEVATVLNENLQSVQQQAHEDCRHEARIVQEMAEQLSETLCDMQKQFKVIQNDQTKQFKEVASMLTENILVLQEQVHKDCRNEVDLVSRMASQLSETMPDMKEEAKVIQTEMSRTVTGCQEVFDHLNEVCLALAEHLNGMGKSTQLITSDYRFRTGLKDSDFRQNSLRRVK